MELVGKPGPANGARLRIGKYHADLAKEGFAWTRRTSAADILKPGDLVEVEVQSVDDGTATLGVTLEQTPIVEGALVAIENRTGQVKALVGGWSFDRSKFNRAVQAYRQLGSTFKPVVYTTAIDRGFTPASVIVDAPVAYDAGSGQVYSPQNYDHKFEGPITLRRALEDSRNIPAVKTMDSVGPANVVFYAKRFGFERRVPAVSVAGARRRRGHADGGDERLHGVPERRRAHEADRRAQRDGSRRQSARGEPDAGD